MKSRKVIILLVTFVIITAVLAMYYLNHRDKTKDGFALGSWISQLRSARRGISKIKLTEKQIAQLDEIGMLWEKSGDIAWKKSYSAAVNYYQKHGNIKIPATYKTEDGFALGKWIARQQYAYSNPEKSNAVLTVERIELLKKLGVFAHKNTAAN